MTFWDVAQTALPWTWIGMVVAISFMEAPLKFRAPGITLQLGVGIGRLVFRALNAIEAVLALALTVAIIAGDARSSAVWALLAKAGVVRPWRDRRAIRVVAGEPLGPSRRHIWYIALEVVTVGVLGALGVVSLDRVVG